MSALSGRLWGSRSPVTRAVLVLLGLVLVIAAYVLLLQSAGQARERLNKTVMSLRIQLAHLEQQAAEYERLRTQLAISTSPSDILTLIKAQTDVAGLSRSQVRIEAQDANQVLVAFGAIPFAEWLVWLNGLQSQQIRLETCRIEALSTAGIVSVTSTFVRSKPQ